MPSGGTLKHSPRTSVTSTSVPLSQDVKELKSPITSNQFTDIANNSNIVEPSINSLSHQLNNSFWIWVTNEVPIIEVPSQVKAMVAREPTTLHGECLRILYDQQIMKSMYHQSSFLGMPPKPEMSRLPMLLLPLFHVLGLGCQEAYWMVRLRVFWAGYINEAKSKLA